MSAPRIRPLTLAAVISFLWVAGCSGGGGDTGQAPSSANSQDGASSSAVSAVIAASDLTGFDFSAVAGQETGLKKLAKINGRIALGSGDEVRIDFGNGLSAPGLLHNCGGVAKLDDCEVWGTATYAHPGTYTFTVTYQPGGLFQDPVSTSGRATIVAPGDFVIVSIGDSVASGEGNPRHVLDPPYAAHWDDFASDYVIDGEPYDNGTCHRSIGAGPARAAARIGQTNSVTFVHIACSGASFGNEAAGDRDTYWYRRAQIHKINLQLEWVRERFPRIDVLLLSGGANNVNGGFGAVVTTCVLNNPFTPCSEDEQFKSDMAASIASLSDKYRDLDALIRCGSPGLGECTYDEDPAVGNGTVPPENQVPTVVAITEYFDPTHDSFGNFPGLLTAGACEGLAVGPAEWKFLYDNMVVPLNKQVAQAASDYSWTHVGGIAAAFLTHGYCAYDLLGSPSWVVPIGESYLLQGDRSGTAHPNGLGQTEYADRIYAAVVAANPPRTTASGTTAGQPYTFGTWVATDVELTLAAYNPIRESGVDSTYYAVDDPQCSPASAATGACSQYGGPVVITASGRHSFSFYSTNSHGAPETRARPVEVLIDKDPPVMTCVPRPVTLWPPNGKFVDVTVDVTAVDAVSGPADFVLTAVNTTEGDVATDVRDFDVGTPDTAGSLLVRRTGAGPGRIYTLTYTSQDALGNSGTCDAVVTVPHDQGNGN